MRSLNGSAASDPRRRAPYGAVLLAATLVGAWLLFWQLTVLLLAVVLTIIVALPLTAATDALAYGGSRAPSGRRRPWPSSSRFDDPSRLLGRVRSVVTTVLAIVGGILLIMVTAVYAAINPRPLVTGALRIVPPPHRAHASRIMRRLRASWLGWIRGTLVDMVLTGALTYGALSLLGIRHALIFSVLTALLEVVPYLGPILAAIPPILYALTQSVELAVLTLVAYGRSSRSRAT